MSCSAVSASSAVLDTPVCVCALILNSVLDLWKKGVKDAVGLILCIGTFALMELTSVSPVLIIVAAALIGVAAGTFRAARKSGSGEGQA